MTSSKSLSGRYLTVMLCTIRNLLFSKYDRNFSRLEFRNFRQSMKRNFTHSFLLPRATVTCFTKEMCVSLVSANSYLTLERIGELLNDETYVVNGQIVEYYEYDDRSSIIWITISLFLLFMNALWNLYNLHLQIAYITNRTSFREFLNLIIIIIIYIIIW